MGTADAGAVERGFANLRQHLENSVLHLLDRVRDSVRPMHLNRAGRFVHRQLVPLQMEFLVGQRKVLNRPVLAKGDVVVVAGVKPAAHVQSGDMLTDLVGRIGRRAHPVAVEVLPVERRLAGIVEMRNAVPQPVGIAH